LSHQNNWLAEVLLERGAGLLTAHRRVQDGTLNDTNPPVDPAILAGTFAKMSAVEVHERMFAYGSDADKHAGRAIEPRSSSQLPPTWPAPPHATPLNRG
jgi:hypothetical protein